MEIQCERCGCDVPNIMVCLKKDGGIHHRACPKCYNELNTEEALNYRLLNPSIVEPDTAQSIMEICESLAAMLTEKNEKYGDSALNPLNIFSKVPTGKALLARIDDKLARIKNNDDLLRDDIMDITGYLILLMIENDWVGYNGEEKL